VSKSLAVSWTRPTTNSDGSALTDISGYQVIYGASASNLSQSMSISGASTTSALIGGLTSGTYYVAVRTVNSSGSASPPSGVAAAIVQ
jgi:hypothetical protein